MCGAAEESILLALAIKKNGSEEDVLKDYKTGSGRGKLENALVQGQNSHVRQEFTSSTVLLNYWRDESSHGTNVNIQEEEAFTSLLLLLRFAQFADSRWAELTTYISAPD